MWSRLLCFLVLFLSSALLLAGYSKKLLEPVQISSTIPTADSAIETMWFSEDVGVSSSERVIYDTDLIEVEYQAILSLIKEVKQSKVKNAKLTLNRYGIGDERITQALIAAKKAGVQVTLMTDLNRALEYKDFPEGEQYTFDFEGATWIKEQAGHTNTMVKAVKALRKEGFQYLKGGEAVISSQPLYPQDQDVICPINHEKALCLDNGQGKKELYFSSANMSGGTRRVNRLIKIADPLLYQYYCDAEGSEHFAHSHMELMLHGFAHHRTIKDAKQKGETVNAKKVNWNPLRINYQDGTFLIFDTTDGQYNPYDRLVDELERLVESDQLKKFEAHWILFLMTNTKIFEAQRNLLTEKEFAKLIVIAADRFLGFGSWGVLGAAAGIDVYRPFGKPIRGFSSKILDQTYAYAYQRRAIVDGEPVKEYEQDGPPVARHLLHEKTLLFEIALGDEEYFDLHLGSFNPSNNVRNSEYKLWFRLKKDSEMAKGVKESAEGLITAHEEWALDMRLGILRNAIGLVTGHTDLEVPLEMAQDIRKKFLEKNYDQVMTLVEQVSQCDSDLIVRPDQKTVSDRIQNLRNFFAWFKEKKLDQDKSLSDSYMARAMASLVLITTTPDMKSYRAREIMNKALWRPKGAEGEGFEALIEEGLKVIGYEHETQTRSVKTEAESVTSRNSKRDIMYYVFDIDHNLINTTTPIILFHKETNEPLAIPPDVYAKIKDSVGNSGDFEDYEIRHYPPKSGSFQYFYDSDDGYNHFKMSIVELIQNFKPSAWQGKSFWAFVETLLSQKKRDRMYLVTARAHSAEVIRGGIEEIVAWLKTDQGQEQLLIQFPDLKQKIEQGKLRFYLPNTSQIHCVGEEKDIPKAKKERIEKIMLDAEQEGGDRGLNVRLGFSDDDSDNLRAVQQMTETLRQEGKIGKRTKTVLIYTGQEKSEHFVQGFTVYDRKTRFDLKREIPYSKFKGRKQHCVGAIQAQAA